jgi:dienelactone hydrolase
MRQATRWTGWWMALSLGAVIAFAGAFAGNSPAAGADRIEGTAALDWEGDLARRMVDGIDRFLLEQLERSVEQRGAFWDRSSPERFAESLTANRQRLGHILGVRDQRQAFEALELMATTAAPALVGTGSGYRIYAVRWPVIRNIHGEGLWLVPDRPSGPTIIAVPDADQTPEMIVGLMPGVAAESQFARRLAENGCRVLVPVLISREWKPRNGRAVLTNREYLYRSAFELGRHLIGYELQKILAAVDWFSAQAEDRASGIGVFGYGEGGMLALYAGALDPRIDSVVVSGYFDSRQTIWQQPLDRNVFGLLERFGDAELAAMIAPRDLIVEVCRGPELELPGKGGAPAVLRSPDAAAVRAEVDRARELGVSTIDMIVVGEGHGGFGSEAALTRLVTSLGGDALRSEAAELPQALRADFAPAVRQQRQVDEIDDHNQWLLVESPYVRQEFMKRLDSSSIDHFEQSQKWYRDFFRDEVIGCFDLPLLPPNARSRKTHDASAWSAYEVVLDVFPDVFAYGILLVPKDLQPGEQRPVVVCQHGLEGRPQDIIQGDHPAYHDFAAKLAERGFITFSPQNLYLFQDDFRTLQRKANPLKKTLFSIMTPQHQQIVDWLGSLPWVDSQRIGFYGLSYGGKSAMRIPVLVPGYCLSICSADFNDWVWKNASTRAPYSYVWTGEYEIFEFDLGSTFNYAEMAALIAPRPFMVERGHFDGVAPDERVAYEFAKVRHLYNARLGIGDRTEIEWFVGPHTIHGQGTFDFLHRHLDWPLRPDSSDGDAGSQ